MHQRAHLFIKSKRRSKRHPRCKLRPKTTLNSTTYPPTIPHPNLMSAAMACNHILECFPRVMKHCRNPTFSKMLHNCTKLLSSKITCNIIVAKLAAWLVKIAEKIVADPSKRWWKFSFKWWSRTFGPTTKASPGKKKYSFNQRIRKCVEFKVSVNSTISRIIKSYSSFNNSNRSHQTRVTVS